MKHILFLLTFCTLFTSYAQTVKPDFDGIKKSITDEHSVFYYPDLFKRYTNHDTTLNVRDYLMLYYGYFFNEKFTSMSSMSDENRKLMSYLGSEKPDWNKVIKYGKAAEVEMPFDLQVLGIIENAYKRVEQPDSAQMYRDKVTKILSVILQSGDGLSENTAYYILSVPDEYFLISISGGTILQRITQSLQYDCFTIKDSKGKEKKLYFNIEQIYAGMR